MADLMSPADAVLIDSYEEETGNFLRNDLETSNQEDYSQKSQDDSQIHNFVTKDAKQSTSEGTFIFVSSPFSLDLNLPESP
jgi:hypothetical protein